MKFLIIGSKAIIPSSGRNTVYLRRDNWNDWHKYQTQFYMSVFDTKGELHEIGSVKVGQYSMAKAKVYDYAQPHLEESFDAFDEDTFSVGQEASYYSSLAALPSNMGEKILRSLNDLAIDEASYRRAIEVDVTTESLLRSVHIRSVEGEYRSILDGGAVLTRYNFTYTHPPRSNTGSPLELHFRVQPDSRPPTNIHVLVGRNGVGKTFLLNSIARAVVKKESSKTVGEFVSTESFLDDGKSPFDNLVSVAFSAFDKLDYMRNQSKDKTGTSYSYVGLRKAVKTQKGETVYVTRDPSDLQKRFSESAKICATDELSKRWTRALKVLESDPLFQELGVTRLTEIEPDEVVKEASEIYDDLSSGHKIVLLTITKLIELVEERTLVLIDEPESHLHPPLLSAFIRALSELLANRNGVAIIATHSPVVLQEVPQSCVWQIDSSGEQTIVYRPEIETFGENIGVLTRAVFGLEVFESGFHKMIKEAVQRHNSKDGVIDEFNGKIGSEARALINGMFVNKQSGDLKDSGE